MLGSSEQLFLLRERTRQTCHARSFRNVNRMAPKINAHVFAALLSGMAGTAIPAWSGSPAASLEANRKLIITDAAFTADKYILDQACIMVELYYRMDEDE